MARTGPEVGGLQVGTMSAAAAYWRTSIEAGEAQTCELKGGDVVDRVAAQRQFSDDLAKVDLDDTADLTCPRRADESALAFAALRSRHHSSSIRSS